MAVRGDKGRGLVCHPLLISVKLDAPVGAFMPVPENLPSHAKEIFERVMETLKGKTNPRTGKPYTDEERGKIAWNAVKNKYKKVGEKWEAKSESEIGLEDIISNLLEFKAEEGKHYFKGYLSTFDIDFVNDLITQDCMKDMLEQINIGLSGYARKVKGSPDHDVYWTGDQQRTPISRIMSGRLDNKGLFIEGVFNSDHPEFPKIWNQIQGGFLDGLSIEYRPIDFAFKDIQGKKVRVLNKVLLKGYGHTPRPANPFSTLTDVFVKSLELADADEIDEEKTLTTTSTTMETGTSYSPVSGSIPVLTPTKVDNASKVRAHLEKDKQGWLELAKKAAQEAEEDEKLLEELKQEKEPEEDEDEEAVKARITAQEGEREKRKLSEEEYYAFPRLKKLPIFDAAHVRNAMARFNQTQGMSAEEKATAKRKIIRAAKKFGIEVGEFADVGPEKKGEDLVKEEVKEDQPEPQPPQKEEVKTEVKEEPKVETKVEVKAEVKEEKKEEIKAVTLEEVKALIKDSLKDIVPEKKGLSDAPSEHPLEVKTENYDLAKLVARGLGG